MSRCELIELQDLRVDDPIELAAPAPPPGDTQVVRLHGDTVDIEAPVAPGAGHHFLPNNRAQLTWCDLCGEFIWGLQRHSLRCSNCSFTCHLRCRSFIQLSCSSAGSPDEPPSDSIETDTNVDEQTDWNHHELSAAEVHQKVHEYNSLINSNLSMVLNKDGSYTGFIKVYFQLLRPVSLPAPPSPGGTRRDRRPPVRRTSFYLPKDAAKHLHVSSSTRAREVIEALLKKFTVVDNPAKFALFERTDRQNQVCTRKLGDDERPLCLRLSAGPSEKNLSLVLKENETGEVNWDAFSFPELRNFLRILQREEEEHVRQIVKRYAHARDVMRRAAEKINAPT